MDSAALPRRFGRYELITLLARGGMAEVYLARMTGIAGFSKQLVIKRILPHLTQDPEFVDMFLQEGRISARLNHPNICQVYELGEANGDLFLAMEYLEGISFGELIPRLPRGDGYELRCAAAVLGQLCEGLHHAHELRDAAGTPTPVIHRDVSPHNLMITVDGVGKLLDFGVCKVLTEGTRTRTGMLKGKLPYMAPEQIRGESVDPRADVFSMGVVLWEALTGERLFQRDSDYQVWRAITEGDIPSITSRRPDLPREIDAVVARALDRTLQRRYPTIRALAAEVHRAAEHAGGPLDHRELAALVRTVGGERLARRAGISPASGTSRQRHGGRRPIGVATDDPAETLSVQLRDESVPIGRRRHRRWPRVAIVGMVVASGVAAIATVAANQASHDEIVAPAPLPGTGSPSNAPAPVVGDTTGGDNDPGQAEVDLAPVGEIATRIALPVRPPAATPRSAGQPAARFGRYSVDSRPYATIYVDGKRYGETPLFKILLPPGKHHIRAVCADGRAQYHTVTIEPGKLFSSGTLTW